MKANDLRESYLNFFEARGHKRMPSAPLLPENDPTVLFTTAGMHPLVPFLLGENHPLGNRLVNFQKCIRTNDIEEVGDASHLTFFEMLGSWSLGDYFKNEAIPWSFEFLTQVIGLDTKRLAVSVFAGDGDAPKDDVAAKIWNQLGIPQERIFFLPKEDNWWGPIGTAGPCGPDSEIFFDTGKPDHPGCRPGCSCGKWLEIWNNVFMEYQKEADGTYKKLHQRNVDTGVGFDRTLAVLNDLDDIFKIETIYPLIQNLEDLCGKPYSSNLLPFRVITDHLRAATFAVSDGAVPSNVEAGYVVRRMLRRAIRFGHELGIQKNFCATFSGYVVDLFSDVYPDLVINRDRIAETLDQEEIKFGKTLAKGLKQYYKVTNQLSEKGEKVISGTQVFDLFETYGFPLSLTVELAGEGGMIVDEVGFKSKYDEHKNLSRQVTSQKFKGGLSDNSIETSRLHTATHLLHEALRRVLGTTVHQMGSNITVERLRFDFSYPEKLTDEQLIMIENIVNEQIGTDILVTVETMPLKKALEIGALAFFGEKYGDQVKVYSMGSFSKEVCGGPHANRTGELGHFRIVKQESVGQGVRRIRAVLEYNSE